MITQFALRLIFGLSVVWCVLPRPQVSSGFFRIQMLVVLGLSALAFVAAGRFPLDDEPLLLTATAMRVTSAALAACSFLSSVMWTLERRNAGSRFGFLIAAGSGIAVVLGSVSGNTLPTLAGALYWLSELSMGLVSGAVVGAMLLGHWYLTAPTMSLSPLERAAKWLMIAGMMRLLVASLALVFVIGQTRNQPQTDAVSWTATHSVWLSLEWLGGIIGPLVIAAMVARILGYRNTQSATGVLFVGVILVFLGEMTGALLRRELGLPL